MILTSPETNEISAALAAAQGEIAAAPKDSVNPHFKSRYADLAACWAVARAPLSKHGLAVVQVPWLNGDVVTVTTRLAHKSGQWFQGDTSCKPRATTPQDIGAAGTYLKRYGFCALIGVVADDDDDGNQASGRNAPDKGKLLEKKAERQADAAAARAAQKAVTERPPAVDGGKPGGTFTGTEEQEVVVAQLLAHAGVPREFWDEIRRRFMGKKLVELNGVIDAVRKGAIDDQGFQDDLDRTF